MSRKLESSRPVELDNDICSAQVAFFGHDCGECASKFPRDLARDFGRTSYGTRRLALASRFTGVFSVLYSITTEVSPDDAAELAGRGGTKKSWWLSSIVKPMREELAELRGVFVPTKLDWKKKFISGDEGPF